MINNLSSNINNSIINYPITEIKLPFSEYIARSRAIIEERRTDLQSDISKTELIIHSNSPFELYPTHPIRSGKLLKYGVLLIHGLLDSPFTLREIGTQLQANGMLCRSILLPGHGTIPQDLLSITYHEWIQAVRYGLESLRKEVAQIYLVGYSTGATLAIYQALQNTNIAGMILLAPAIQIKAPVDILLSWNSLNKKLSSQKNQWLFYKKEEDYAKYTSLTVNAAAQVALLSNVLKYLGKHYTPPCPMLMVVSRKDETISSQKAIEYFSSLHHKESKLLIYTSSDHSYSDIRISNRQARYPELHINHISHIAIPFSPANPHYGQHGDFKYASHIDAKEVTYGAYNNIETSAYDLLYKLKLVKKKHQSLTYNPDFNFMTEEIVKFILRDSV